MINLLERFDEFFNRKRLTCFLMIFLFQFSAFRSVPIAQADEKIVDNGKPIVVSMGDSYSSGEGIEPFYDENLKNKEKVKSHDWLAHRSEKSWPGMLEIPGLDGFTRDDRNKNWFFVASSGAETKHLKYEQDKKFSRGFVSQYGDTAYLPAQLDVFDKFEKGAVDYVTISIGGNDAGFASIVTTAFMKSTYLGSTDLSNELDNVWAKFYKDGGIRKDIYNAYKDIEKAAGPQAQIIVAGYPRLLDENGKGMMISKKEAALINNNVTLFNKAIEDIVKQCQSEGMKICFVSVEEAFSDHGAYSNTPYIHKVYPLKSKDEELVNFTKASAYSMHPTYDGAIEYAKCVNEAIENLAEEEIIDSRTKEREVVLVLDASGSMSGTPLEETKNAAHKFVDTVLKSDANIGIVSYDDAATVQSVPSDNKMHLDTAIGNISCGGSTNIESGLKMAHDMLSSSNSDKKIIVLMSDGEPNEGKVGQDLIDYANELKEEGYYIYTLGFFSGISNKTAAQSLMDDIASEGCHYEVTDADSLVFFFGDIADQISGDKFIYVRIACPVDVTVTYNNETMTSKNNYKNTRSSFGTMTFEENDEEIDSNNDAESDNRIKILRLREGVDYDIKIEGNGRGKMDYSIGFMDNDGEYSDMRKFSNIKIKSRTEIDTVATVSNSTYMYVDENGDGKYDLTYRARPDSKAELVDYTYLIFIGLGLVAALILLMFILCLRRHFKIKRYL